jgi:hypothetical protein
MKPTNRKPFLISLTIAPILLAIAAYLILIQGENKEFIKDQYDDKTLVEFFDVDTNELRLQIITEDDEQWIQHPVCCKTYEDHIPSNEILFDRENKDYLIVNGESFRIQFIGKREQTTTTQLAD